MAAEPGPGLFSLEGQVFIVTGASGGIGLAIARGFAAAGATVGLNSRSRANLERVADSVPGCDLLPFDVADMAAAARAVEATVARHGRLDGIVCNAAARDRRPLAELAAPDFRALLETNLVAPFELARLAVPHMLARGRGRLIFLSSIAAELSNRDPIYSGTKGGINGLLRGLAVELGPHGITANAIAPGPIATEMNMALVRDPERSREYVRQVPLGRWGRPEELAGAAIFLASEAGSYVNGHVLTVDGGASVKLFG